MIKTSIFSLCEQTKKQLLKNNKNNTELYIEISLKEKKLKESLQKIKETTSFKEKYELTIQINNEKEYIHKIIKTIVSSPGIKNYSFKETQQNISIEDFVKYHNYSIYNTLKKKGD